jgi:uncharacterized membrane protein
MWEDKLMSEQSDVQVVNSGSSRTLAIVTYATYLLGLGIIGLIIAYVKRPDSRGSVFESHFTYAIRTFWISFLGFLIGGLLSVIGIGLLIMVAVGIWLIVRCVKGIIKALDSNPIDNPATWWV